MFKEWFFAVIIIVWVVIISYLFFQTNKIK
jgi:hypothetical protein